MLTLKHHEALYRLYTILKSSFGAYTSFLHDSFEESNDHSVIQAKYSVRFQHV